MVLLRGEGIVYRRIFQSLDNSCLAAVLGMIVGESEEYVLDWFRYYDPPFCDEDAILFLAHHGVYLGTYFPVNGQDLEDTGIWGFDLEGRPLYLVVKGRGDRSHAVFWDGFRVLDPDPGVRGDRKLEDYEIIGLYPMMYSEVRYRRLVG